VAVTDKLSAHGAFESFVLGEEAGVVNSPHKFHFVRKLSGREGCMSFVKGEIYALALARGY
jgi:hypothetical protein